MSVLILSNADHTEQSLQHFYCILLLLNDRNKKNSKGVRYGDLAGQGESL